MRNSSICAGRSGVGGTASSQALRSAASSSRKVLFAPAPAGGLTTSGKADPFGKFEGVSGADGQLVPGARHAGRPQHRLHLRLVAEVVRRDRVHPGDAQVLPHLGQRDLQLLQHGQQPLHRAELAGQALHRGGDLARVERVVDPPVPGQALPELGRQPAPPARR